jgi:hypothetical protein
MEGHDLCSVSHGIHSIPKIPVTFTHIYYFIMHIASIQIGWVMYVDLDD